MGIPQIVVRALFTYLYLLLTLRMSGKRMVSQAGPFDFVISIVVGDLFDDVLWANVPYAQFVAAVSSVFLIDALIQWAAFKSDRVYALVNGAGVIAMLHGEPQEKELRGEQISRQDLAHLLRGHGYDESAWPEVRMAVLERDHEMSVLPKTPHEDAQKKDRQDVES